MGAEPNQLQRIGNGYAVNKHEIGPNVAVAMVFPLPGQGVIVNFCGKGLSAAKSETAAIKSNRGSSRALSLRACNPF